MSDHTYRDSGGNEVSFGSAKTLVEQNRELRREVRTLISWMAYVTHGEPAIIRSVLDLMMEHPDDEVTEGMGILFGGPDAR